MSLTRPLDALNTRRCALAMLLCLFGFVALLAAAMRAYPGGNWLDRAAIGHRFFANFFCDLTQPVSLSGVSNALGARLAQLGMLCLAASLAGFFWLVPGFFSGRPLAVRAVRGFGEGAVLAFVAVPLMPSERFGQWHAGLALFSGALGLVAAGVAVSALWLAARRALATLGALTLTLGALEAALFVAHLKDVRPPLILPALQKVIALLLTGWVIWVAWLSLDASKTGSSLATPTGEPGGANSKGTP